MSATGDYLAALRKARCLSKYAVAAQTGISHSNLWKIEHDQRFPSAYVIALLVCAYDLTVDEKAELLRRITDDRTKPYRDVIEGEPLPLDTQTY